MKEVDVRGLSCPEPLILTKEALKIGGPIKVIVNEPHQKNNIEMLAIEQGKKVSTSKNGRDFEIVIE